MTATIIIEGLLDKMTPEELLPKLEGIADLLEHPPTKKRAIKTAVTEYLEISQKQTTHLGRREDRQRMFLGLLDFM
jgi:hypothetical protein